MAGGNAQLALDRVEAGESLEISKKHTALPPGLTRGMLMKDVLRIAGPSFVELTLTQLTSMADLMMVGQLGGVGDHGGRLNNAAEIFNDDNVHGDERRGDGARRPLQRRGTTRKGE